jgi:protein-glutamine gamma-glutamyltransferase
MSAARTPLTSEPATTRTSTALVLAGFATSTLLNAHHIAWWSLLLVLVTVMWRLRSTWSTHQLPGRLARVMLVVILTTAVILSFRRLSGVGAGATLLVAMIAAKLVESRTARDWFIVIYASLFLLCAACLDRQELWRAPLYLAQLCLLLTALRAVGGAGAAEHPRQLARNTARTLAYAIPLAVLLFVFFPRLPGGFWSLPRDGQAITGLGDELSPGSISQLSESDEVALRVRFDGPLPPPQARYWRGPVMHDFDGYTWRRRPGEFGRTAQLQFSGVSFSYDITLEPNSHNVLIALELPEQSDLPFTLYTGDYQLISPRPAAQARSYHLKSWLQHRDALGLSALAARADIVLPKLRNQRSQELGRSLRAGAGDDAAFVKATLNYLRTGGFEYTLTPPLLNLNSIDDLLFNTHQGFCGHYASAFATLMRAGGVPARVVTGYLGGEWNPIGGYLTVRQSHAHAWTEVWLPERGWTRVDPTAVVAPERLTRDIFDFMPGAAPSTGRYLRTSPWVGRMIQSVEALNAWWQDRVIGYDFRRQLAFLDRLGIGDGDWRAMGLLLGAGSSLWLLWIGWTMRDQFKPVRRDALARIWLRLESALAKAGYARAQHEGPLAYAERVGAAAPVMALPLAAVARRYATLRYGAAGVSDDNTAQLRADVERLKSDYVRLHANR